MKKVFCLIAVLALLLSTTSALAAGKLSVDQENFHVVPGYWTYGYAYAKVENAGDKPIKVQAGVLEIYDENGDVLTSTDRMSPYAEYLQPGEYTYVSMYSELEADAAEQVDDYMLTLTGKSDNTREALRLAAEPDLQMNVQEGWWTYNYLYVTVTNDTQEPVYDIQVVLALLDEEGNILYVDEDSLYSNRALTPGSSMIIRKDISSNFIEYFEKAGLTPASVDAIAYSIRDVQ